jgi:hypothetical protein
MHWHTKDDRTGGEEGIWHRINRAIDDPSLGAVLFVQRIENVQVLHIYEVEEMNREI